MIAMISGKNWSGVITYRSKKIRIVQYDDPEKKRLIYMKAREFDKKFDEGKEDISKYLDISKARKPKQEQKLINVDFPLWMIQLLDKEVTARFKINKLLEVAGWRFFSEGRASTTPLQSNGSKKQRP